MPLLFPDSYWFIFVLPAMIIALIAQAKIKSNYYKYKKVDARLGYTGADIARLILANNNITDVKVTTTQQFLGDHYSPNEKIIRLSPDVYYGNSIASVSIAAHEVGHAIQHNRNYIPVKIRTAIVPIVSIGTNISSWFIILGMLVSEPLVTAGLWLFSLGFIFQVITLPVEIDASKRAIKELETFNINRNEKRGARKMLTSAAMTYIAGTVVALANLLRLLSITGRLNNKDE